MARAAAAAASLAALLLQGCGNNPDTTVTTTTATTTTSTSTTTMHPRTKPMTTAEAVAYLNEMFTAYDETNDTSPLGLTISMAAQTSTFTGNIFCSEWDSNPKGRTGCYNGQTDCRMSASLYNHKWPVDAKTKMTMMGMSRLVGYVFNQSLVESRWGKCSFIWDGATGNNWNRGCGMGAVGGANCKDHSSAFWNNCEYATCKNCSDTCTADHPMVKKASCQQYGGEHPVPTQHGGKPQCHFPGAAYNYHNQDDWTPSKDYLRDMATYRTKYNDGKDAEGPSIEKWNEVVLDETLLMPDIWYDPAVAIPAFIYLKSRNPISANYAKQMRDQFCKYYQVDEVPIVEVDDLEYREEGPFRAPSLNSEMHV